MGAWPRNPRDEFPPPRGREESGPDRVLVRAGLAAVATALVAYLFPFYPAPVRAPDAGVLPGSSAAAPPAAGRAGAYSPPVSLGVPGHLRPTPVDPVTADRTGAMAVPESPARLGWWALGAPPGAARGTVLLAGHLDSAAEGAGPFEALHDVPLGARAHLTTADGRHHTYRIVARRTYAKEALPQDVFTPRGTPRLVLVTCTGTFDPATHAYAENLVLYGEPAR
ncbi:class F sortase [Streptomyces ficellus]|uniref:Class F sortase n=1 Tax=Streptomyces ficellus TaxID=1977088 RepID=A0A6I6FTP8_9ACTN|nr:class F sortase [Streptomyces ficellus]QGV80576.1 class F sortase [Streptomyces ficellus]